MKRFQRYGTTALSCLTLTGFALPANHAGIDGNSQWAHSSGNTPHHQHLQMLEWKYLSSARRRSLTEALFLNQPSETSCDIRICRNCSEPTPTWASPMFDGLSMFTTGFEEINRPAAEAPAASDYSQKTLRAISPTLRAALQSPVHNIPEPWVFQGNDGEGVKTWLSQAHTLEVNPRWLDFTMFDSMNLSVTEQPPGPGQSEPQEWRGTFTVGLSTDWQLAPAMALHAGYRFYDNPIPDDVGSGAFPNASQHVVAVGMTIREGRHSVSLIYGLDMMNPSTSSGISSARHGDNIDSLAHLASFTYSFSF